jgi:hypothetical protein
MVHRNLVVTLHYNIFCRTVFCRLCFPNFFHEGTHKTIFNIRRKTKTKERQLVAHGDYLSSATCRTDIHAFLRRIFGIFCGVSEFVFVYSAIPCGTVFGKHGCRVKSST